ncbi:MAG TPA: hypothetical protein VJ570_03850 [Holophagaceae bacterium]|nr:hypothetical protein [Holophagaceae bacterium]
MAVSRARALALAAAAALALGAEDRWPEIPPAAWSQRLPPRTEGPGAVVLLDRYHFHRKALERFRRVLVLEASGTQEATLTLRADRISRLEGRTVLPDGKVEAFAQENDVVKFTSIRTGREEVRARRIFPPGIRPPCIVDIRWEESVDPAIGPLPQGYGRSMLLSLATSIPTKRAEITMDPDLADIHWRFRFQVAPGQVYRKEPLGRAESHVLEDIPARPGAPLASKGDLRLPTFRWYWVPDLSGWMRDIGLDREGLTFIDAAACTIFRETFEKTLALKPASRETLRAMGKGLESEPPAARVAGLMKRLRAAVRTPDELADGPAAIEPGSLDAALSRGWGTHIQLTELGFFALRESGLAPELFYAIDREENQMHDAQDLWQYDRLLLAVPDGADGFLFTDPGSTWGPLGLAPWFQGSQALGIRPAAHRLEWTGRRYNLPVNASVDQGNRWRIRVTPGGAEDHYDIACEARGDAAASWRRSLVRDVRSDARKAFGEWFENAGIRSAKVTLEGERDPWSPLSFKVEGIQEVEERRLREIHPFASVRSPIPIPAVWPESRSVRVHLPETGTTELEARIDVPSGLPAPTLPDFAGENRYGKVSWSVRAESPEAGAQWVLRCTIRVTTLVGAAEGYEDLKTFCEWVQKALRLGIQVPGGTRGKS